MTQPEEYAFLKSVSGLFDGTLAEEEAAHVNQYLKHDANAAALYLEFVALDLQLGRIYGPQVPSSEQSPRVATATAAPVLRHLQISRPTIHSIALVALCFYGSFALIAWNLREHDEPPDVAPALSGQVVALQTDASLATQVARLTQATKCRWGYDARLNVGDLLHPGALRLEAGIAEVEFDDGAHLTIEAPCHFELQTASRGYLWQGRVVARVPRRAIGFTLQTTTATVIDLGTEFSLNTDAQGATEVQVIKGKVELRPASNAAAPAQAIPPIRLAAGDGRRVAADGPSGSVTVRDLPAAGYRHVLRLKAAESKQIQIEGAHASSTHPALNVNDLIRGHGLDGEKHSAHWQQTMWHSDYNKIKNEFVLFDLARPHRLETMRVWNFNDAGGRSAWIGVKQADIYVSTTGNGDPLSQPAAWKLVAENQQFASGPGTPDYATPTLVPLRDVVARFVAIVIDEGHSIGPRPQDPTPDVVGLSEVQFFGSRVEVPK